MKNAIIKQIIKRFGQVKYLNINSSDSGSDIIEIDGITIEKWNTIEGDTILDY